MRDKMLFETGSLTNETIYRELSSCLDLLGRKLNVFIERVEREHRTVRDESSDPVSRNAYLAS